MSFGGPPPGGFGGPPPDGPPGGYGGPPPGGPPPGGGFGPPPGGGFGGPPPGGGFGPPPGGPMGGPFGPPPGSPFGPPGPFGAPVQAAPKSGSKLPLILGLGCGGLALLGIIGGVVSFLMVRSAAPPSPVSYDPPVAPSPAVPSPAAANTGDLKAELRDLTPIKSKYGKSMRFVGEIHNTGSADIGYPSAKVTFYDAANTAVDSGVCGTLARVLPPGEKVPCMFSIFKGLDWKTYKVEMTPFRSTFRGQVADIAIADLKFKEKRGYQPDTLEGKLTNNSAFKAKNVWAIVTLYDANKKIVGADNALVAGSDLEGGQSGLFSAKVYDVAGKPESYRVVAVGYSE